MEKIIFASLLLVIYVIWFISVQLRIFKYKRIASELRANYQPQGLFKAGKIVGVNEGKQFTLENIVTRSGRSSTTFTTVSIGCRNEGIPLIIHGGFFRDFPNWKFAFSRGNRKERVFITYINLKNVDVPLENRYKPRIQSLFQQVALLNYDFIKKGSIRVDKDSVSFAIHGVLTEIEIIKQIISLMSKIAGSIEATPII